MIYQRTCVPIVLAIAAQKVSAFAALLTGIVMCVVNILQFGNRLLLLSLYLFKVFHFLLPLFLFPFHFWQVVVFKGLKKLSTHLAFGVVVIDGAFRAGSVNCFHGVYLVIAVVDLMAVQLFLFLVNLDISVVKKIVRCLYIIYIITDHRWHRWCRFV